MTERELVLVRPPSAAEKTEASSDLRERNS